MNRRLIQASVCWVMLASLGVVSGEPTKRTNADVQSHKALQQEFLADKKLLQTNELGQGCAALNELVGQIEAKWSSNPGPYYVDLITIAIDRAYEVYIEKNPECAALGYKWAQEALKSRGESPLKTRFMLASRVVRGGGIVYGLLRPGAPEWPARRDADAELLLAILSEAMGKLDPTFDPNVPEMPYPYPKLPKSYQGVKSLDEITDQVVRSNYIAQLAEHDRLCQERNAKSNLYSQFDDFVGECDDLLKRVYTEDPVNVEHFKQFLGKNVSDDKLKKRFIESLTKQIEARSRMPDPVKLEVLRDLAKPPRPQ